MITLKQFLETVEYRITEGSDYLWNCYGPDSYRLDVSNNIIGTNAEIIFDTKTQIVYEVCVFDETNSRAYRIINPDFKKKHNKESKKRNVNSDIAWDDVNFIDLETDEDFLEKMTAIISGEEYDTRVSIPIDMTDSQLALVARAAHEADITLNEFFERALTEYVKENHKLKELNDTDC